MSEQDLTLRTALRAVQLYAETHEAMCRTLAAVLGHDLDTEETAADIIAGLNAAGYLIAPFEPHECICPRCGIRHGGFTPQDGDEPLF